MSERIFDGKSLSDTSKLISALNMVLNENPEGIAPPEQFGFSAVIQTDKTELHSSGFDFEFNIPFDDDTVPNESTITIFNLSGNTVNNFKTGNELTVIAGYGDDTGVVLKGKISAVKTKHSGVDKITTVYVLDNADYSNIDIVEQTFSGGATASYILKSLLERLKLNIAVFEVQRDHTYESDVSVKGSITDAIKKYAAVCGVSVYIHKLQIYCRPIWKGDNIHFTVCAETGMIDSPEPFEEENTNEEYKDSVTGYNINMLFQHRMATAAIVDVSSKDYKGTYRVCSGTHSFDGLSAITEIKCIENITTSIVVTDSSNSSKINEGDNSPSASSSSMAESVMQVAEAEIGTSETGDNNNKYGKALGQNGVPWCGIFVGWCLQQGGLGLPNFNYASATAFAYAAQKNGWGTYHAQGSGYTPKRGDIFVRGYNGSDFNSDAHVGFVRSSSGGSFVTVEGNSSNKVNTRTLNTASYTFVTPPYPVSSGSGSTGSGGGWVTGHVATTYGYGGDDNGVCGWNGLNYHNISGCHVAIPTYCVKQADCYNSIWAKEDYPELANGYGIILEVRSPDTGKTVRAVTADCGNFGKHNTYNHNAALDLPPNTFNALGLGHGTYDIEYRVVGKVSSWNGEQV